MNLGRIYGSKKGGRNAYGPIVYDGGVCAVNFLLAKYQQTNQQVMALLRVIKGVREYDSWELSFLSEGQLSLLLLLP